jgi:hypothetical protein
MVQIHRFSDTLEAFIAFVRSFYPGMPGNRSRQSDELARISLATALAFDESKRHVSSSP